jgi:hypothetical protein
MSTEPKGVHAHQRRDGRRDARSGDEAVEQAIRPEGMGQDEQKEATSPPPSVHRLSECGRSICAERSSAASSSRARNPCDGPTGR